MAGGPYCGGIGIGKVETTILAEDDELVSECCAGEWDEDTGICLVCKEHAKGIILGE